MEYPNSVPENPLVSVCIQTYNHAPYIAQCIEGALMQKTDFPYEIIIGEDESTDGTREICIEYAEKYPEKIRLFLRREEDKIWINGVKTGRFNFVENLKAARGKFIALCDGDDYWVDKGKLRKQVDFLEKNPNYVGCFHNVVHEYEANFPKGLRHQFALEFDLTPHELAKKNIIATCSFVFAKNSIEVLPSWFSKISIGDWSLFLLVNEGGTIRYLNEVMAVYRIHQNGVWSKLNGRSLSRQGIAVCIDLNKAFKNKYVDSFSVAIERYKKMSPTLKDKIIKKVKTALRACKNL